MIDCLFKTIGKGIKKSIRVFLSSFRTFTIRKRNTRTGRNLQTGDKM